MYFAALASGFEMVHGNLASLNGSPNFGTRKSEREVDEFQSEGNLPVVVAHDGDSFLCNMRTAEDTKGSVHVEITGGVHNGLG